MRRHCESVLSDPSENVGHCSTSLTRTNQRRKFLKMNKFNINKAGMQPLESEKCPRSEKSLSTLTKKFVEMLQAENVLDLNTVSEINSFRIL